MPCYNPLNAYLTNNGNVVFTYGIRHTPIQLPCGRCIGCKLERSRQWAVRCMHEAQLSENNCFITLTYNDEHKPPDNSLRYSDFQKFMRRLRKEFPDSTIRFYMCGEYGEKFERPHFHACIFGFDFPDKTYFKKSPTGSKLYVSPTLERLWPFGWSSIGGLTFESAAYVARYCTKKITGKDADHHYEFIDPTTGEVSQRQPEFNKMSLKPGIGAGWFDKFHKDVYPMDHVIVRGAKGKPPRYYDKLLERKDPEMLERLKLARVEAAREQIDNNTYERLKVREEVKQAQFSKLTRKIE